MKKKLLILILALLTLSTNAQESISEILSTETNVCIEDLELVLDGISTDIYNNDLLERAKAGNGAAQNCVGYCYLNGLGINKDYSQALYWISKSVENNNLKGVCSLGYMYEMGLGVEKNPKKAVELYRKSALMGFPLAWCNLATCYGEGIGTEVDKFRAKAWYEKGARFGYRVAQVRLSYLLTADRNYHDALYWLWRAAKQNSAAAFYYISSFYKAGALLPKDQSKADKCMELYEKLNHTSYGQSSSSAIFDSSQDHNVDVTSLSDKDIANLIDELLTQTQ